ncbi:helix-turn-helix domain-containing protein [Thalassospira profundimaris]|nr:helix-turn-helix domain-containing protein [Thalassospira profundimaris]
MENPYPFNSHSPMEGLQDSMDVLDLIDCLISGSQDLSMLDRNPLNNSISGLVTLVGAIRKNIAIATDELDEQFHRTGTENLDHQLREAEQRGLRAGMMMHKMASTEHSSQQENATTSSADESYPKLSVRDHAIIATYRQGHPVEEIAKAVNLKKQTVQRIIEQLRDSGAISDIDPDSSGTDMAATA